MARQNTARTHRNINPLTILGLIFLGCVYWYIARELQSLDYVRKMPLGWTRILEDFPLFDAFTPAVAFVLELLSPSVLRHFIPVIGGIYLAYEVAVDLIERLYDLPDRSTAREIFSHLRSGSRDTIVLNRATFQQERLENPILRIGGPGMVAVAASDVIVTEINGRFERVLGSGGHRLKRFEYVRSILDLNEQLHEERNVILTTLDGIDVVSDVSINFRIQRNNPRPSYAHLYPFDAESVRKAAYTESVRGRNISDWRTVALGVAVSQLREVVSNMMLDELIDPEHDLEHAPHPLVQTRMSGRTRQILLQSGLELISVRIGGFATDERVQAKLGEYWQMFGSRSRLADHVPQNQERMRRLKEKRIREQMILNISKGLGHMQSQGVSMYRPPEQSLPKHDLDRLLPYLADVLGRATAVPVADQSQQQPQEGDVTLSANDKMLRDLGHYLNDQIRRGLDNSAERRS